MKKLLIIFFAVTLAAGCAKDTSTKTVLAKVNSKKITQDDFIKKIERLPDWAKERFMSEEGKKEFLEEIIKEELLYQEAKNQGLTNEKDFQDKIEEFKKMTLISLLLKKEIEEKVTIDDRDVRVFYDENIDDYRIGLQVKAQHILVDTKEEAEDILKKVRGGESFSELAKTHSNDMGSAQKGGDLGFFSRGTMVPEFEQVAFNTEVGETSGPVKTRYGYHIIKVTDRKKGKLRSFEDVKDSIKRQLMVEKQRASFESYIKNLKEKTKKIEIDEEALKALTLEKPQD